MLLLPPLESLRFFEAAARQQSFTRGAEELGVTAAAVAHRVRLLEKHLDVPLFDRRPRGVRLNRRGQAYVKEVQRILAEVHGVSERQRRWPRRVRIVSVEAVAEKWLVPRLATFKAAHAGVAIELETNHRGVDPDRRDFDVWFAYTGETAARGRPRTPAELGGWPLLYDLGWDADWSYWFARQGESTPDLSRASGFRLYSMLVQAAVHGIGAAIGRLMLIARELESRTLVPLFDRQAEAPERCCLITTAASRQRPEVRAFREWVLDEARAALSDAPRTHVGDEARHRLAGVDRIEQQRLVPRRHRHRLAHRVVEPAVARRVHRVGDLDAAGIERRRVLDQAGQLGRHLRDPVALSPGVAPHADSVDGRRLAQRRVGRRLVLAQGKRMQRRAEQPVEQQVAGSAVESAGVDDALFELDVDVHPEPASPGCGEAGEVRLHRPGHQHGVGAWPRRTFGNRLTAASGLDIVAAGLSGLMRSLRSGKATSPSDRRRISVGRAG